MSYKFCITTKNLSADLNRIRHEIETAGGIFQGDSNSGTFSLKTPFGKIAGTYNIIMGREAQIEITDKPFAVSRAMIESEIKAYLP